MYWKRGEINSLVMWSRGRVALYLLSLLIVKTLIQTELWLPVNGGTIICQVYISSDRAHCPAQHVGPNGERLGLGRREGRVESGQVGVMVGLDVVHVINTDVLDFTAWKNLNDGG